MRKLMLILMCSLFTCLLSAGNASDVGIRFTAINPKSLPSNYVKFISQDSEGFIWIASNNDLSRFDGQNVVSYYGDAKTVDFIYEFLEYDSQTLLLANDAKLTLFNKTSGERTVLVEGSNVSSIIKDKEGNIWAGGADGLFCMKAGEENFTQIDLTVDDEPLNGIIDIIEGPEGRIWMTTWLNGLYVYDPVSQSTVVFKDGNLRASYVLNCDSDGIVWVGTWGYGLLKLAPDFLHSSSYEAFVADPSDANALLDEVIYAIDDLGDHVLVGGQKGLSVYDKKNRSFRSFSVDNSEASLPYNQVNSILVTENSNVYLGLYGGGVCRMDVNALPYEVDPLSAVRAKFSTNTVNSICADDQGCLWMGIPDQGFILYDPYKSSALKHNELPAFRDMLSISTSFTIDRRRTTGEFCFGTFSEGLWVYDPASGDVRVYDSKNSCLRENSVLVLDSDVAGNLWVGTSGGLYVLDAENELHTLADYLDMDGTEIPSSEVSGITSSDDGLVYVSMSEYGILEIDPERRRFRTYDAIGQDNVKFRAVLLDSNGCLWAGSTSNGLFCLDTEQEAMTSMNGIQELNAESVCNLVEARSGEIWFTTTDDIVSFVKDPEQQSVTVTRYISDLDVVFSQNTAMAYDEGIVVGTSMGLFHFRFDEEHQAAKPQYSVVITDFLVNGESYKDLSLVDGDINYVDAIKVKENDNIEIRYALLDYSHYLTPVFQCSVDGSPFQTIGKSLTFKATKESMNICLTSDIAGRVKTITVLTDRQEQSSWGLVLIISCSVAVVAACYLIVARNRKRRSGADNPDLIAFEINSKNITTADKDLLEKTMKVIHDHLGDAEFKQADFIKEVGISRTHLNDKVKELTGFTPINLLLEVRLKTAYATIMAADGKVRISEVAYSVGFNDAKYFSTCFRKKYGVTPTELLNRRLETLSSGNPEETV